MFVVLTTYRYQKNFIDDDFILKAPSHYDPLSFDMMKILLKDRLIAENICVTDTTVRPRVDEYLFDIDCVNEALVNAIVHNDWTISEPLISFYDDRLDITSHGGIPREISQKDFFNGVSHPRNSALMRIFLKLALSSILGMGFLMTLGLSVSIYSLCDSIYMVFYQSSGKMLIGQF